MKLIQEIINELVDAERSIASPLLKTKVLASRLQNNELLNWVTNELKGYDNEADLPSYRKYTANILGTFRNGNTQHNSQPVPTMGLGEYENWITAVNLAQSISGLENLKAENNTGLLEQVFPAEVTAVIEDNWRKMGNPHLQLFNCRKSISISAVSEILSVVRNNLLDFMLKIDSEFGGIVEIEELKTKKAEIATIMNQTIINNTGDGNVLNTGDNSKISAKLNIRKGSKDDLQKQLSKIGIDESDAKELVQIIDIELPNDEHKTFGKPVNNWIQKMIGKALDGTWNIGIGAAGTVLAEAIKTYYGI